MAKIEVINESTFENQVLKNEKPVLVDFYADWCGPCKMIAPIIEEVAEEHKESLSVFKVNVDECQDLAVRYGIRGIPTLIIFKSGENVSIKTGAIGKSEINELIGKYI